MSGQFLHCDLMILRQLPDMNFRKGFFFFLRKIESTTSSSFSFSHLKTVFNVWYWFVVSLFLGYFTVSLSLWFHDDAHVIICIVFLNMPYIKLHIYLNILDQFINSAIWKFNLWHVGVDLEIWIAINCSK